MRKELVQLIAESNKEANYKEIEKKIKKTSFSALSEKDCYGTMPGELRAILKAKRLPVDNLSLLLDVCILKYPFDPRLDADFTTMKSRKDTPFIANAPFFQDLLWALISWLRLVRDRQ